jgi:uroporphyrinogen decarboxylase
MCPKERIRAVLDRRPVDRLPVDLWHTPEIGEALRAHTGAADDLTMYKALGLDKIVWVFMGYRTAQGETAGSQVGAKASGKRTMWGAPLKEVQVPGGRYEEFAGAPMAGFDTPGSIDDYPWWPDPDLFDYDAAVAGARAAACDFAVIGPWVSLLEIYCQMRGLEQALVDLATSPALVEAVLDRVEAIQTEMMRRFFARAADCLDLVFVSDDAAGQTGLLISPAMWRRHLQPRMARWCELIHSYGLRVFYHTDGAAEPLIGPLIECGIDVLNPIQHACPGMDMGLLKANYGRRVIFHGGVDNQSVLPFGTPEEVRAETLRCLGTLGAGKEGFICCSCHNVQPGTPLENILAMVETARTAR